MADKFITELNTTTSLTDTDMLAVETSATPETKSITWDAMEDLVTSFLNYQITTSVTSSNLTVAIKARDGSDASNSNQIKFVVGSSVYTVDAAVSFTKNAGTNWCNAGGTELKTQDTDFFVYAIGETGASAGLKFGFSRIPYCKKMGDFTNTTTSEKYIAGNWTTFNSTDVVRVIGRFNATNSGTASFNWSIPATSEIVSYPTLETRWLACASTMTGFSSSGVTARYRVANQTVFLFFDVSGTSNATSFGATAPFASGIGAAIYIGGFRAMDNNAVITATVPAFVLTASSNVMTFYKDWGAAGWTASSTKAAQISFFYLLTL
jgi:hypothetical protein